MMVRWLGYLVWLILMRFVSMFILVGLCMICRCGVFRLILRLSC